jgi:hypothetical protein
LSLFKNKIASKTCKDAYLAKDIKILKLMYPSDFDLFGETKGRFSYAIFSKVTKELVFVLAT